MFTAEGVEKIKQLLENELNTLRQTRRSVCIRMLLHSLTHGQQRSVGCHGGGRTQEDCLSDIGCKHVHYQPCIHCLILLLQNEPFSFGKTSVNFFKFTAKPPVVVGSSSLLEGAIADASSSGGGYELRVTLCGPAHRQGLAACHLRLGGHFAAISFLNFHTFSPNCQNSAMVCLNLRSAPRSHRGLPCRYIAPSHAMPLFILSLFFRPIVRLCAPSRPRRREITTSTCLSVGWSTLIIEQIAVIMNYDYYCYHLIFAILSLVCLAALNEH